jgi:hypothetical protein
MKTKFYFFLLFFTFLLSKSWSQCANPANIYSFTYNGHNYEVVKELKNWTAANTCAIERGGYLVCIESDAEKNQIMGQLMMSTAANISPTYYPVIDGGGASYIWTGGTDRITEGSWLWEGSPIASFFYIGQGSAGTGGGSAVGGAYINWGNLNGSEPDNYFYLHDQDALGIAMNSWPHGVAGQWNDIDMYNTLYFIIEKSTTPTPCQNPTGLGSFNVMPTSAKLKWTSTAPNFSLRYKPVTATTWQTMNSSNDTISVTSLIKNTNYHFQVKALCSSSPIDTSAWSTLANFTTLNDIGIEEIENNIEIFPNPVRCTELLEIKFSSANFQTIELIDITGKSIINCVVTGQVEYKLDLKGVSKGMCFIKITSKDQIQITKKVVIE